MSVLLAGILGSVVREVSVGRVTSGSGTRGRGLRSSRKGEPSVCRSPLSASTVTFLRLVVGQQRPGPRPAGRNRLRRRGDGAPFE